MEIQALHIFCLLVLEIFDTTAQLAQQGGPHSQNGYMNSPYHYEYHVKDDKEYLNFGQEEEDDGNDNVHGYYHVQLPDGRRQTVDYQVSGDSGYIADVKYDGESHHPSEGHNSLGYTGHIETVGRHSKTLNRDSGPNAKQILPHESDLVQKPRTGKVDPVFISAFQKLSSPVFQGIQHSNEKSFESDPQISKIETNSHLSREGRFFLEESPLSDTRHHAFQPSINQVARIRPSDPLETSATTRKHSKPFSIFSAVANPAQTVHSNVQNNKNNNNAQTKYKFTQVKTFTDQKATSKSHDLPNFHPSLSEQTQADEPTTIANKIPQLEIDQSYRVHHQESNHYIKNPIEDLQLTTNIHQNLPSQILKKEAYQAKIQNSDNNTLKYNESSQQKNNLVQQNAQAQSQNHLRMIPGIQDILKMSSNFQVQEEILGIRNTERKHYESQTNNNVQKEQNYTSKYNLKTIQVHTPIKTPGSPLISQTKISHPKPKIIEENKTETGTKVSITKHTENVIHHTLENTPAQMDISHHILQDLQEAETVQKFVQVLPDGSSRIILVEKNKRNRPKIGEQQDKFIQQKILY